MRITLAICIAIGINGAAFAQSSSQYKTWPDAMRQVEQSGTVPPGWSSVAVKPAPIDHIPDTIVINFGQGGVIAEHRLRFADYRKTQAKIEVRGPCYSACTMLLSYIEPENLCIGERAFMGFHAVRSLEHQHYLQTETYVYFANLPQPVQQWINGKGGWQALQINSYLYLRDRELWAMGYPKCN